MRSIVRWGACVCTLTLASGCVAVPKSPPAATAAKPGLAGAKGIVFCADGAGGFGWTTEALAYVAAEERVPIHVELVDWSHGRGLMITDNCHWRNTRDQGRKLADMVRVAHERYPALPVYLVGHSAGCAVCLEAARDLPADSVERIVLLAPSVSPSYDLRPALTCSRKGVDSFMSKGDWVTLGIGMRLFGTTDRQWTAAAGRLGFRKPHEGSPYAAQYAKLREHVWQPSDSATGHRGGHYGNYVPGYLKAKVLPLLNPDAPTAHQ
jgi:pimeloyl-ACP methyl ester carboxylesterase